MAKTILLVSKNFVSKVFKTDCIPSHKTVFLCCIHAGYKKKSGIFSSDKYGQLYATCYMLKKELLLKM